MDPRHFLRILYLRWPIVVVLALLFAATGWVTAPEAQAVAVRRQQVTLWQATNIMFVDSATPGGLTPAQLKFFANFEDVPSRVADRIDGSASDVASQITLTVDDNLGLLRISTTNVDAEYAVALADAYAEELDIWLTDRIVAQTTANRDRTLERVQLLEARVLELDAQIAATGASRSDLIRAERDSVLGQLRTERDRLQQIAAKDESNTGLTPARKAEAIPISGPAYFESLLSNTGLDAKGKPKNKLTAKEKKELEEESPSKLPADFPVQEVEEVTPAGSNKVLRAGAGGMVGALIGLGIIALLALFDRRIRTRLGAETAFGLPVLAEIPKLTRLERSDIVSWTQPESATADAHRALRTALSLPAGEPSAASARGRPLGTQDRDLTVVMIASPDPGDGKSTTAANLGAVLAQAGQRVLVVECDFRKPSVAARLGVTESKPFGAAAVDDILMDFASYITETSLEGLCVARTTDQGGALADRPATAIAAQRALITEARKRFDVVLLDTAPLLATNDAADLLPVTDAVLFVARIARTRIPDAERVAERFERLHAPMAGVVLLAVTKETGRGRYVVDYLPSARAPRRILPGRAVRLAER